MTTISAKDVVKLRQLTGAGMMDCKQALTESTGDVEKAVEMLRKKGRKLSLSRAHRATTEGRIEVQLSEDRQLATILSLSCETDFVAKNEDFVSLAQNIAKIGHQSSPKSTEELLNLSFNGLSIEEHLNTLIAKIGEKITLSHYQQMKGTYIVSYIHAGAKIGVLVALEGAEAEIYEEVGRNIAMQIAAMSPIALDKEHIPEDVTCRELEIGREIAKKEGKPEAILEKIAQGRLQKFFKEQTLLAQAYVKDNTLSVTQYLKSIHPSLKVNDFLRITVA